MSATRRLRVELVDQPGALAKLATLLAEHGADVLSIDIHEHGAGRAVDEVSVRVTPEWDLEAFSAALGNSGVGSLLHVSASGPAGDRVVAALQWAGHLVSSGVQRSELELAGAIVVMCSGATAWVGSPNEAADDPLATEALAAGRPITRLLPEAPQALASVGAGPVWVLAVADDPIQPRRVALVARPEPEAFTTTEVRRIAALLELAHLLAVAR